MASGGTSDHDEALRRAGLVLSLRSMGMTDHKVLSAFESTAREVFAPPVFAADAYADRLIPIACGQMMEAPKVIGGLLKAVPVTSDSMVLEIGTGSGYFAALLAKLARRVITLDRFRSLADAARHALQDQRISNVDCVLADGLLGWPSAAPYHAIFVTGAVETPPPVWLAQLASGGSMIVPVGSMEAGQVWVRFSKDADGMVDQDVLGPAFAVPLIPGLAKAL